MDYAAFIDHDLFQNGLLKIFPNLQNAYDSETKFYTPNVDEFLRYYQKHYLYLIKKSEESHKLLEKGIANIDGNDISVETETISGECLLSNINRIKYGIELGTNISKIDYNYFKRKLDSQRITSFQYGDFYAKSLTENSTIHFVSRSK